MWLVYNLNCFLRETVEYIIPRQRYYDMVVFEKNKAINVLVLFLDFFIKSEFLFSRPIHYIIQDYNSNIDS